MRAVYASLLIVTGAGCATSTASDTFLRAVIQCEDPDQLFEPGEEIAACTTALESGRLTKRERIAAHTNRGESHLALQDRARALEDANAALAIDPNNSLAYRLRGRAHYALGQYDRAIADYSRLIELNPTDPSAIHNRGVARAVGGDHAGAIADYDAALALDPARPTSLNNRALALVAQGEIERALADYDAALSINNNYASAYANRGAASRIQGLYERAMDDFDRALSLAPNDAETYADRCWTLAERGRDLDVALTNCNTSLAFGDTSHARTARGLLHLRRGETDRALEDFDAALRIAADNHTARYGRGVALSQRGQSEEGSVEIEAARSRDSRVTVPFERIRSKSD